MKRLALDTATAFSRSFASSVFDRKASLEVDMLRRRNFSKTAAFWAIAVSTLLPASFSRYAVLNSEGRSRPDFNTAIKSSFSKISRKPKMRSHAPGCASRNDGCRSNEKDTAEYLVLPDSTRTVRKRFFEGSCEFCRNVVNSFATAASERVFLRL